MHRRHLVVAHGSHCHPLVAQGHGDHHGEGLWDDIVGNKYRMSYTWTRSTKTHNSAHRVLQLVAKSH